MIKVLFICSGGMSTALIGKKLEGEASKSGKQFKVWAAGSSELKNELDKNKIDIVMVAPQIKHKFKELAKICDSAGVKCAQIKPDMYVPMDMAIRKLYTYTTQELEK